MPNPETSDFPVTRRTLNLLDDFFTPLAQPFLPPNKVEVKLKHIQGFQWDFREKNERTLMVGKAVRMVSGIRAAMILADEGYTTECGTILRTVADFAYEIMSICEGCESGKPTVAQQKFVEQYFLPIAKDPDEYDKQKRENWVTRDQMLAALWNSANKVNANPARYRKLTRHLSNAYDKYVHGAYITAMELYDGRTNTFMLRGHAYELGREIAKRATASKLHHALTALMNMAQICKLPALVEKIGMTAIELHRSGELS
jgi:hypothetical protein